MTPESGKPSDGELILYRMPENRVLVEVLFDSHTFWLNQKRLAEVFGELVEASLIRKFRTTAADGNSYLASLNSLDATISVGYRRMF